MLSLLYIEKQLIFSVDLESCHLISSLWVFFLSVCLVGEQFLGIFYGDFHIK